MMRLLVAFVSWIVLSCVEPVCGWSTTGDRIVRQNVKSHSLFSNRRSSHSIISMMSAVWSPSTAAGKMQSENALKVAPTTASEVKKLVNDLMVRAAKGEVVERTPVWVFRQAGRHLPEYTAYKSEKSKNFLELLQDPADVAECTMQPIRRYNLDAAILFSDILVILQALGIDVEMPGGKGITVPNPIADPEDFKIRILPKVRVNPMEDTENDKKMVAAIVNDGLSHVMEAVRLIKIELEQKIPLIGFSAAPWTLMFYLVGGSSKKNQTVASKWLKEYPTESKALLGLLTDIVTEYLSAQVRNGADLIQLFEAMGEHISLEDMRVWAMPCMKKIATAFKAKHPEIPLLVFPRGACYPEVLADLQDAGYDVVSIDTATDRKLARATLLESAAAAAAAAGAEAGVSKIAGLQGNLDVKFLQRDSGATVEAVQEAVRDMISTLGPQKLIANLGEGLMGKEDPELVAAFIDSVHSVSEELIKQQS